MFDINYFESKEELLEMEKLSVNDMNDLADFLLTEVAEKVLYGISYTLLQTKDTNKERIEKYLRLRDRLSDEGVSSKDAFRVNKVSNGYIFELDLSEAVSLTERISKDVSDNNGGETPTGEFNIRERAADKHREDMGRLRDRIIKAARNNNGCVEVALYSRNKTSSILVTGSDSKDSKLKLAVKYDAFAVKVTDIKELNESYLSQAGLTITAVKIFEILPSETGIRAKLNIVRKGDTE